MTRILLVEDEEKLARFVELELAHEGYEVERVADGRAGVERALGDDFDLVLLDILLPKLSGMEVLRRVRREKNVPIIMLSARDAVMDKVAGLDAGADDYVTKPFAIEELLARVRAMLRRKDTYTPDLLEACGLVLDRSTFELSAGSERLSLSAKEYQIVEFFMNHAGMIISADKVLTHIWGWESDVSMSVLWVHISNIRKKLAALGAPASIRFVRGSGYILEASKDASTS